MSEIADRLSVLLPKAVVWAELHAATIQEQGRPLTERQRKIATGVGVSHPEHVRICLVPTIPFPEDPILCAAALEVGLVAYGIAGLTLGHGIYIVNGRDSDRLIAHECRHIHQYEQHGSIEAFLTAYLAQVLEYGYTNAPLERDAQEYEGKRS